MWGGLGMEGEAPDRHECDGVSLWLRLHGHSPPPLSLPRSATVQPLPPPPHPFPSILSVQLSLSLPIPLSFSSVCSLSSLIAHSIPCPFLQPCVLTKLCCSVQYNELWLSRVKTNSQIETKIGSTFNLHSEKENNLEWIKKQHILVECRILN